MGLVSGGLVVFFVCRILHLRNLLVECAGQTNMEYNREYEKKNCVAGDHLSTNDARLCIRPLIPFSIRYLFVFCTVNRSTPNLHEHNTLQSNTTQHALLRCVSRWSRCTCCRWNDDHDLVRFNFSSCVADPIKSRCNYATLPPDSRTDS